MFVEIFVFSSAKTSKGILFCIIGAWFDNFTVIFWCLIFTHTCTNSVRQINGSELLTNQPACTWTSFHLMKIRGRAFRYTFSFMLESLIRTEWKLSPIMNIFFLLLIAKLWSFSIDKFKNFISTLLHNSNFWKVLISHNYVRCLKI